MPAGVYTRTKEHRENLSKSIKKSHARPEVREKISKSNKGRGLGRKLSKETRAKMSIAKKEQWAELKSQPDKLAIRNKNISKALKGKYTGSKSSNWRGGVNTDLRTDHRKFAWRDAVLRRDNYTCQICEQYGGDMHIDHIKSWSSHPDLRFEVSNGRTLCRPCHYYVTFKRKMPKGSRWGLSKRLMQKV